jgi:phosphoenolpyruvate carboxykinase (GTP)
MIPGETVVGDDLAYLRRIDGHIRAVNAESGIFGIIRDVNESDDPVIWKLLAGPGEVIFSNVLVAGGAPYWLGDGREHPEEGVNHSGRWRRGKRDAEENEVPPAHPNARYTLRLSDLDNLDPRWDDPEGVPLGGVIYGGRDSDTSVPVQQSFDWAHGVITMGAALESETTAATLGKVGVRSFQPMSIQDFLSITIGDYIRSYLEFGSGLERVPTVFAVNYFLKGGDGKYLTGMKDKYVWLKWMEHRANGELGVVKTPTGYIPRYDDLVGLFKRVLGSVYEREDYDRQFLLRVPENLARIDRIVGHYEEAGGVPRILFTVLAEQRRRLEELGREKGDRVAPGKLA